MKNLFLIFCFLGMCKLASSQSHWTASGTNIYNNNAGNVGIGTTNPASKLDVNGLSTMRGSLSMLDNEIYLTAGGESLRGLSASGALTLHARGNMSLNYNNNDINTSLVINNKGNTVFKINDQGNVGIGTSSPGSHKLAVNGKIRTKEINVETGWADFVFKADYKLRSLKETEAFIRQNGHLPEIPSEKEVAKEGINLGEMNAKLLQKIEELTLHLIEQNKRLDVQQKEITLLKSNLKSRFGQNLF